MRCEEQVVGADSNNHPITFFERMLLLGSALVTLLIIWFPFIASPALWELGSQSTVPGGLFVIKSLAVIIPIASYSGLARIWYGVYTTYR